MKNYRLIFRLVFVAGLVLAAGSSIFLNGCDRRAGRQALPGEAKETVKYWTCGMHPSVHVTDREYEKGNKNCPICNMPLTSVYEEKSAEARPAQEQGAYYACGIKEEGHCPHCDEGKSDAECICGGHSFAIEAAEPINCPVCGKPLEKLSPDELPAPVATPAGTKKTEERRVLYYRSPMNPALTSQVPAKDQMGMDFIPVYEEGTGGKSAYEGGAVVSRVKLGPQQIKLAGTKTEALAKRQLYKIIRTVGKVAYDPELAVAQEEFLTAVETREKVKNSADPGVIARAGDLIEKSKFRLRLLGMSADEIVELEKEGKAQLNLVLPEDKAWVYADIYEYELAWVKIGQGASITTGSYPGEEFKGAIRSINPVINPMTRAAKARIEALNADQKLKPEMYVEVSIKIFYTDADGSPETLAVPKDAILDTGLRKIVYLDMGDGLFLGREIQIGPEAIAIIDGKDEKFYPVISGLKEGERAVTRANFLIDSQSQLTGGISGAYGGAIGAEKESNPPVHQH